MSDKMQTQPFHVGAHGELITPIDIFRAAESVVGSLVSGNITSGNGLTLRAVSSLGKMRVVNAHLMNKEGGWVEIALYDGGRAGQRIMGPYRLQPYAERTVPYSEVVGSVFTSSMYVQALSGWTAQPLSNGVDIKVGWVPEALDIYGV